MGLHVVVVFRFNPEATADNWTEQVYGVHGPFSTDEVAIAWSEDHKRHYGVGRFRYLIIPLEAA